MKVKMIFSQWNAPWARILVQATIYRNLYENTGPDLLPGIYNNMSLYITERGNECELRRIT